MTDPTAENPTQQTPSPGNPDPGNPFTDEQLEFLHATFDLARDGRAEELVSLIDQGIPVTLATPKGDSYLMLAAYNGHVDLVRELLARGADTEQLNQRGQTPLAGAVFKQYADIATVLLEAGADPEAGTPSAIDTAKFFELPAMVDLIEGHRAGQ